jgi:hypothetical protein
MALRTKLETTDGRSLMLEIEMRLSVIESNLNGIYYFPSTIVALLRRNSSKIISSES